MEPCSCRICPATPSLPLPPRPIGHLTEVDFPTVLGAVVPTYHIEGVTDTLKFTGDTLGGIFLGSIKKWNDAALKKDNPGVNLPDKEITVVHRSDSSGTSFVWTDYLAKVNPAWKSKVGAGAAVNWPVGLGGKGNEGVSGLIKENPNSIGYVELIYAVQSKMSYGVVRNSAGTFVKADFNTVTEAASGAAKNMPDDFRVSITNAPGKNAYPISSFTWLLIPVQAKNPANGKILADFLNWMVNDGQKMAPVLTYAPLPESVAEKVKVAIKQVH